MSHIFTRILAIGLLAGSLAMAGICKFELSEKLQAGQTQLQPGKYSLAVDGSTVVLKDKAGKAIEVKAKVEQTDKKAPVTLLGVSGEPGAKKLGSITIGGTQTRVVFE